jgi:hypothetical protein
MLEEIMADLNENYLRYTSRHGGLWVKPWTINSSSFLCRFGMVAREPDLLVACVALIALHSANILGLTILSILSGL